MGHVRLVIGLFMVFMSLSMNAINAIADTRYVGVLATGDGTGTNTSNLCGGLADSDCTPAAGDTVYLCGAWTSTMTPQAVNGTVANPIVYEWDCPGNPATLTFDAGAQFAFNISGRAYWTVNNLRIQGKAGEAGPTNQEALVFIGNGSNHITLNRPTVWDNSFKSGLYATNANTLTINDLTAYNNAWYGAYVYTGTYQVVIDGYTTYSNARAGIFFLGATQSANYDNTARNGTSYGNGDGAYASIADHILFENNVLYSNTNVAGSGEGYGIGVQQVTNVRVVGNTIHDNRTDGIEVWGDASASSNSCEIVSNTIYNHTTIVDPSGSNGIEIRTGYSDGCQVFGNLLWNNRRHFRLGNDASLRGVLANNTTYLGQVGVSFTDSNEPGTNPVTGWTIRNNVFSEQADFWLDIESSLTTGNSNTFANNIFFGGAGAADYNGVTYTAGTINSVDSTAITTDPLFLNPTAASPDFRTGPSSPVRRAGSSGVLCLDVRGRTCPPDRPNIGAYQSTSGDPAAPRAVRIP